jgi:Uma2 family endonuclease
MDTLPLLPDLLASEELAFYLQKLQEAWQAEQSRRRQFYTDLSPEDKAEFIMGEVVYHSPALSRHNRVLRRLVSLAERFTAQYEVGEIFFEKCMLELTRNSYEPDFMFYTTAVAEQIMPDTLIFPVPQMIAEILSPSTAKNDTGIKKRDYERHNVTEYWIIDPEAEWIECYKLKDGSYDYQGRFTDGVVVSEVMGGMKLPVRALFDDALTKELLRNGF